MSYQTAVAQMYALGHELAQTPSNKFDLAHMRVLLSALGDPQNNFPSVLIAGTNGKGSTSATLASILQTSGLKTGLYTSPHLVRINERICFNGKTISDDVFATLHDVVDRTAERLVNEGDLPWHPSFFEMLTAIAFEFFARNHPDIVVLEVGMGGRLDATNIVDPRVSVITDISLDHQKYLGETIAEIALEKAGIVRSRGVVVTLPQLPEANDAIGNAILNAEAKAVNAVPYVPPVSPGSSQYLEPAASGARQQYPLEVLGTRIMVDSPLVGRHQLRNIALAIAAAVELREQGFGGITASSIEKGIHETRWAGRFQELRATEDAPQYVFDVAHNPAGAWALRSTLSAVYGDSREITLVFGVMQDKAVRQMTEILFPVVSHIVLTSANNPRSATPAQIKQAASRMAETLDLNEAKDVASALDRAREITGPKGLIVVTGSIFVVGEAMQKLNVRI